MLLFIAPLLAGVATHQRDGRAVFRPRPLRWGPLPSQRGPAVRLPPLPRAPPHIPLRRDLLVCAATRPPPRRPRSVVVIGGGAAGYLAAIEAAETVAATAGDAATTGTTPARASPPVRVTILEATSTPLAKVAASGGGRCNVTHDHTLPLAAVAASYPRGRPALRGPLTAFGPAEAVAWFAARGVALKTEADGRMFPITDSSATVVDALAAAAAAAGVFVRRRSRVTGLAVVRRGGDGNDGGDGDGDGDGDGGPSLAVSVAPTGTGGGRGRGGGGGGGTILADAVILATGSARPPQQWVAALGHAVVPPVPSLFTFAMAGEPRLAGLAGLSVARVRIGLRLPPPAAEAASAVGGDAAAPSTAAMGAVVAAATHAVGAPAKRRRRLGGGGGGGGGGRGRVRVDAVEPQEGPLLITHWGISGPAVLRLSAFGARSLAAVDYKATAVVCWLPDLSPADVTAALMTAKRRLAGRAVTSVSPFPAIPRRLWRALAAEAVGDRGATASPTADNTLRWADLPKQSMARLATALTACDVPISGKGVYKDEFVTAGGVDWRGVDRHMASRHVRGLYFAGEVLDVDGVTGGFNFQAAWTTGWLAGRAAARAVMAVVAAAEAEDAAGEVAMETTAGAPPPPTVRRPEAATPEAVATAEPPVGG